MLHLQFRYSSAYGSVRDGPTEKSGGKAERKGTDVDEQKTSSKKSIPKAGNVQNESDCTEQESEGNHGPELRCSKESKENESSSSQKRNARLLSEENLSDSSQAKDNGPNEDASAPSQCEENVDENVDMPSPQLPSNQPIPETETSGNEKLQGDGKGNLPCQQLASRTDQNHYESIDGANVDEARHSLPSGPQHSSKQPPLQVEGCERRQSGIGILQDEGKGKAPSEPFVKNEIHYEDIKDMHPSHGKGSGGADVSSGPQESSNQPTLEAERYKGRQSDIRMQQDDRKGKLSCESSLSVTDVDPVESYVTIPSQAEAAGEASINEIIESSLERFDKDRKKTGILNAFIKDRELAKDQYEKWTTIKEYVQKLKAPNQQLALQQNAITKAKQNGLDVESKNQTLPIENGDLRKIIKVKDDKIKEMEKENEEIKNEKNTLANEMETLREKETKLTKDLDEANSTISRVQTEMSSLTEKKENLAKSADRLQQEIDDLNSHLKEEMSTTSRLRQEREKLYGNIDKAHATVDRLRKERNELRDEKQKPKYDGTLLLPTVTSQNNHLIKQVLDALELKEVRVVERKSSEMTASDPGTLVVPCVLSSRLESDLCSLMEALELGPYVRAVVIVYHHIASEKSRPLVMSTHERLAHKYPQCLLILDAHFWEGYLYECSVNNTLADKLLAIIQAQRLLGQ